MLKVLLSDSLECEAALTCRLSSSCSSSCTTPCSSRCSSSSSFLHHRSASCYQNFRRLRPLTPYLKDCIFLLIISASRYSLAPLLLPLPQTLLPQTQRHTHTCPLLDVVGGATPVLTHASLSCPAPSSCSSSFSFSPALLVERAREREVVFLNVGQTTCSLLACC